jgi:hypothetical protein
MHHEVFVLYQLFSCTLYKKISRKDAKAQKKKVGGFAPLGAPLWF